MPNLDVRSPIKVGVEDMVIDAFSAKESADMLTNSGLVIKFKCGLDSFSLKDN